MTFRALWPWLVSFLVLAAGSAPLLQGCQSLAGIEERGLGPCGEYCEAIMATCRGEDAAYASFDTCLGVCERLPVGDPNEPAGSNSIACRLAEVRLAANSEPDVHCPRAGPAGGGSCGADSPCESYCTLFQDACPDAAAAYGALDDCEAACSALVDTGSFSALGNYEGDTLQCRLVHVSAATVDDSHCVHARLVPPTAPCTDPPTEAPSCERYCDLVADTCEGENAQYESVAQCRAACAELTPGTNADTNINTVGCRIYHAYNALLDPATHCPHAGPTGDGHCGQVGDSEHAPCESFCAIAAPVCGTSPAAPLDPSTCTADCRELPGSGPNSHYTVARGAALGDTLACRMVHAVRALQSGDASSCGAVGGGAPCE